MTFSPITSWQIDMETMKTMTDFTFLDSKMPAQGDCSHEIKRCLFLGRKAMTNLDSALKSRNVTLATNVHIVKAMVFLVVMCRCESWTIKKAEHWRIDTFELWCWRRLLRVPWTAKRWNQSILKEINSEYSLEGLMLKLQYLGYLCEEVTYWKRPWCWERLKAGGEGDGRGWDDWWHHWLNGHELSKLWEIVKDREACRAAVYWIETAEHTECLNSNNKTSKWQYAQGPWHKGQVQL